MATVTPNFNWPVPTSTDLVKDGATAIEALGDSIDASLLDLKGGTTGQVLSKTTNTDMDFTWVTTDDANAIQNSIVDAKGDLIAASANDTPARLAVGANGETLVADSSTSTGLRYQSGYNGNAIINGGFDIWQRGTSFTATATAYTADRWNGFRIPAGATISRQVTGDTTNLPFIQYCARAQRNSGNTDVNVIGLFYSAETADSLRFAGRTVTLSFYARAGANFSAASSNLAVEFSQGFGTDQNVIVGGFTGKTNIASGNAVLTTTWQRFTFTGTMSSTATQIGIQTYFTPVGTAGAADYYELTGVQVELGSVPTTFKRSNGSGGTIQGELAACQRYYWRNTADNAYDGVVNGGIGFSTTQAFFTMTNPVTMRSQPTSIDYSTTYSLYRLTEFVNEIQPTAISLDSTTDQYLSVISFTTAGSLTQFRPYIVRASSTTGGAYIGISAEL
jgi:hypothetical protein